MAGEAFGILAELVRTNRRLDALDPRQRLAFQALRRRGLSIEAALDLAERPRSHALESAMLSDAVALHPVQLPPVRPARGKRTTRRQRKAAR